MEVKIEIPWFSKYINSEDWMSLKLLSDGKIDQTVWGDRLCGLACLRMVIDFYVGKNVSMVDLLKIAVDIEAFSDNGLIHAKAVQIGQFFNLNLMQKKFETQYDFFPYLQEVLKRKKTLITSISNKSPFDGVKGGHLVVIKGYVKEEVISVVFVDSNSYLKHESQMELSDFLDRFSLNTIEIL